MKCKIISDGSIIYVKSEKRWRGKIHWVNSQGEKKIKSFAAKTKGEIKTKISEFRYEVENMPEEKMADPSEVTFKEYADEWFNLCVATTTKKGSSDRKRVTLKNQVYPYIGHKKMSEIIMFDVQNMANSILKSGLSYSTAKKAYEAVDACFKSYRINYRNSLNPCEGVRIPTETKKDVSDITYFSEQQCELICKEAVRRHKNGESVYRLGHAIIVLMYTGLRIGELLAVKWKDIDHKKKELIVDKNTVVVESESDEGPRRIMVDQDTPKTKKSKRIVPLPDVAINSLMEIKKINGRFENVMCTKTSKRVHPRNINRLFHCILTQTKLFDILPPSSRGVHTLRHTYASIMFRRGASLKMVSEILGHADTKITENIYIHVTQEDKNDFVRDINKYLPQSFLNKRLTLRYSLK